MPGRKQDKIKEHFPGPGTYDPGNLHLSSLQYKLGSAKRGNPNDVVIR